MKNYELHCASSKTLKLFFKITVLDYYKYKYYKMCASLIGCRGRTLTTGRTGCIY